MLADEYDALIADPCGFPYDVWLPRISTEIVGPGRPNTRRNNLALAKGAMAMEVTWAWPRTLWSSPGKFWPPARR